MPISSKCDISQIIRGDGLTLMVATGKRILTHDAEPLRQATLSDSVKPTLPCPIPGATVGTGRHGRGCSGGAPPHSAGRRWTRQLGQAGCTVLSPCRSRRCICPCHSYRDGTDLFVHASQGREDYFDVKTRCDYHPAAVRLVGYPAPCPNTQESCS